MNGLGPRASRGVVACRFFRICGSARQARAFFKRLIPGSGAVICPASHEGACADEFIRRFLIHVLPRGFHRIRHYGLFASAGRAENIARARELLHVPKPQSNPTDADTTDESLTLAHSCPCCGGRMVIIETFKRGSAPRNRPAAPTVTIRVDTS